MLPTPQEVELNIFLFGSPLNRNAIASAGYAIASAGYAIASTGYANASAGYANASAGYAIASTGYANASTGYANASAGYAKSSDGSIWAKQLCADQQKQPTFGVGDFIWGESC